MLSQSVPRAAAGRVLWSCLLAAGVFGLSSSACGQNGNGNGNGNNNPGLGGISIDAEGVLSRETTRRPSGALAERQKDEFAKKHFDAALARFTDRRVVSLRAVEQELMQRKGRESLPAELEYLYGLQQIQEILVDAEQGDILLAGPAEGFAPDQDGRMRGLTTGRPPLRLDDLLVALRAGGRGEIGCSIDPDPQRLARLQEWLRANSTPASRSTAQRRYPQMARILDRQNIRVWGVAPDTHFALTLVEADYHMKLIALGKERPGVRGVRSQLSLITPEGNTLQRWWFVTRYDPIEVDAERLSFRLSGPRAQVLAQEEWTDASGSRSDAALTRESTWKFAQLFSEHFEELAEKSPTFAELQNLFDLAVLAALLRQENLPQEFGWSMPGLLDPSVLPARTYPIPRHIDSLFATTNQGDFVLGLIGGVHLNADQVVRQPYRESAGTSQQQSRRQSLGQRPANRSSAWWDDREAGASETEPTRKSPSGDIRSGEKKAGNREPDQEKPSDGESARKDR